jgi:predicted Zn finger-like uncharacterized protein
MFTVCPKCALTLVVTAQDLRVAQGYVRCGRCSNVFNAIVALTDDRGVPQSLPGAGAGASSPGTASTSIMRKAPSINDDVDPLETTGETEALYAEPDRNEARFQEVFSDASPAPAPRTMPFDSSRPTGPISFVAPPPGPPVKAPPPQPVAPKKADNEKRYSDTEGIDTYPENELEFNPDRTDLSKVFVEAAPVAFRNNAETGTFEKIVLGPNGTPANSPAQSSTPAKPAAAKPSAPAQSRAPSTSAPPGASRAPAAPTAAYTAPPSAASAPATSASTASASSALASGASSPAPRVPKTPPPGEPSPPRERSPRGSAPPARTPARDAEDQRIDSDLRSLAARLDSTASRPAPKPPFAANDEAIPSSSAVDDDEPDTGDIYSRRKAPPRPRPAPPPKEEPEWALPDDLRSDLQPASNAEIEAVGVDSFASAPPRRNRMMMWVAGAAVLSVALAAQAVHHNRHDLATSALLNRPLTSLYRAIGVPLVPNWDLRTYDVRQLGASTGDTGQGTLTVRASLKNGAPQSRPLPLLRITMQDRYGNRVATRDVLPKDYVPGAVPADAVLGAGQRVDAEMTFKDPGQNAVGFEIDACLPKANGRIACANDLPTAR